MRIKKDGTPWGKKKSTKTRLKKCINCGKIRRYFLSEIRKSGKKYCSRKCSMVHLQKNGGFNRKSATMTDKNGYILQWVPNHPNTVKGYVSQHRVIMEAKIGRYLTSGEVVHHINEVKYENRIENLQLMSHGEHSRLHCYLRRMRKKQCS